jgi:hypothetical protein
VTVSPDLAVAPVPVMRSAASRVVGGDPVGVVTGGGLVPKVPAAVGVEMGARASEEGVVVAVGRVVVGAVVEEPG